MRHRDGGTKTRQQSDAIFKRLSARIASTSDSSTLPTSQDSDHSTTIATAGSQPEPDSDGSELESDSDHRLQEDPDHRDNPVLHGRGFKYGEQDYLAMILCTAHNPHVSGEPRWIPLRSATLQSKVSSNCGIWQSHMLQR